MRVIAQAEGVCGSQFAIGGIDSYRQPKGLCVLIDQRDFSQQGGVAWVGFVVALAVSLLIAPWRIAVASAAAFLAAQLLDIVVFNRWRRSSWWKAPFIGSMVASVIDTAIFFSLAFAGTDLDWRALAAGDLAVKALLAIVLLAPYRAMLPRLGLWVPTARA